MTSLTGSIAWQDGEPSIHAHAVTTGMGYDAVATQEAVKKAEVGFLLRWLTVEARASRDDRT
ncbi:hypothetical protein [Sagittula sp. S175]|uniref:hypothetical protein n=1 Tax=Sagittula sp. S175 TaxID=3415129 RepID=UPI003C7DC997